MMRRVSLAATTLVLAATLPATAWGPCSEQGCLPASSDCLLVSCGIDNDTGLLGCTYYCDTNGDQQYDQTCDMYGTDVPECSDLSSSDGPILIKRSIR